MPIIWEAFVKCADFVLAHEYVGMYFYSAVFQGNMALLALFGVFLIFRLQALDQDLIRALNDAKEFVQAFVGNVYSDQFSQRMNSLISISNLKSELESWVKNEGTDYQTGRYRHVGNSLLNNPSFVSIIDRGISLGKLRKRITGTFYTAIVPIALIIGYSMVMMVTTFALNHSNKSLELLLIIASILLEFFALKELRNFASLTVHDGN